MFFPKWTETNAFAIEPQDPQRKRKITAYMQIIKTLKMGYWQLALSSVSALRWEQLEPQTATTAQAQGGCRGAGSTSRGKSRDSCAFFGRAPRPYESKLLGWVGHCCPPGGGGVVIPFFLKGIVSPTTNLGLNWPSSNHFEAYSKTRMSSPTAR